MKRLLLLLALLASQLHAQTVLNTSAAPAISVSLSPTNVPLSVGVNQNFVAVVQNDFLSQGVTWTVTGAGCSGATCGSFTNMFRIAGASEELSLTAQSVTYTAPASIPSPAVVTITATSVQDNTKFATATVTIGTGTPIIPQTVTALNSQSVALGSNTFPIPSTAGNTLAVGVNTPSTNTVSGVKACLSNGTTCTALSLQDTAINSTSLNQLPVYVGVGIPSAQAFLVVSWTGTPTGTVAVAYSDISNGGAVDTSAHSNNQSGANPTGPSVTTTVQQDYVASFLATTGTVSVVSSPFTLSQGSAGFGFVESFDVSSVIGAVSPSYIAGSGNWESVTVAIKPTAASGAPISVALVPTTATVQVSGGTKSFTATITNDPANAGAAITYTGTGCAGAACGTGPSSASSNVPFTYTAPASVPGGTITRVQHGSSSGNLSGGSASIQLKASYNLTGTPGSSSMTLNGFTTVGNLLVLPMTFASVVTVTGVTDNKGNVWTVRATSSDSTGGDSSAIATTATTGATSGVTSITVTATGTCCSNNFYLYDLQINPATWTFTTATANNGASTTTPAGPSITPTGAGIVITAFNSTTGSPQSVASPFTLFQNAHNTTAYDLNTGTSTLTPTYTTGAGTWSANDISIAETAGSSSLAVPISSSSGGATDLLCGFAAWDTPNSGTLTVTDNQSQTYTTPTGVTNGPDWGMKCVYGGVAGVTQLNFSVSSNPTNVDVYYFEYTGILSATVDQFAANNALPSGTTLFDSGFTGTTTNTADLLLGFAQNGATSSFTAGNDGHGDSYTLMDQQLNHGSALQNFFPTTATNTYKSTMTTGTGAAGEAAVFAFKGSSASSAVSVKACSVTDGTKCATSTVTLQAAPPPITVTIAPTSASVQTSLTQAFTPTDSAGNSLDLLITCGGSCGSLSTSNVASGTAVTYTAPSSVPSTPVTLTATDHINGTSKSTATITVFPPVNQGGCGRSVTPTGGTDNSNWTNTLNAAIAAGTCMEVKAGTYSLDPFHPPANSNIQLDDGVTVQDTATGFGCGTPASGTGCSSGLGLFNISNNNITIAGAGPSFTAVITTPVAYASNLGNAGGANTQYNHCVRVDSSSSGLTLSHVHLTKCGGDGIGYTSGSNGLISNVVSDTNIRQGGSITGTVNNLTFTNDAWNNNNAGGGGTGFDIEPDGDNAVTNIVFNNNTSTNNPIGVFSLGTYNVTTQQVTVTVNGWTSTNDKGGGFGLFENGPGSATFNNLTIINNSQACVTGAPSNIMPVKFNSLVCTNPAQSGVPGHYGTGVLAGVELGDHGQPTGSPGNVTFNLTSMSINNGAAYFTFGSGTSNTCFNKSGTASLSGGSGPTTFNVGTCP